MQKKKGESEHNHGSDVGFWQSFWARHTRWMVKHHVWKRLAIGTIITVIVTVGGMYGIAQWYIQKHKHEPLTIGATFIPGYARYYDLDPRTTLAAIVGDLGVKRLRLVSYWDEIESTRGLYNFDELDWQFGMAENAGVKVSLAIGLRQPRWPECHMPSWAQSMPNESWEPPLYDFIGAVIDRYKNSPALDSYQLENEYFLKVFGLCTNFDRERLVSEYDLVKRHDPNHTLVVSMSNNAIGTPIGDPTPDQWAISVYKRVWDKTITRRYFEYPIPAWYYAFRAGWTELARGRNSFIHELQAEAWTPDKFNGTKNTPLAEQDKSMNPSRLKDRIKYGEATGMRTIDLWGVEWWYWRKTQFSDSGLWDTAKAEIARTQAQNAKLTQQ